MDVSGIAFEILKLTFHYQVINHLRDQLLLFSTLTSVIFTLVRRFFSFLVDGLAIRSLNSDRMNEHKRMFKGIVSVYIQFVSKVFACHSFLSSHSTLIPSLQLFPYHFLCIIYLLSIFFPFIYGSECICVDEYNRHNEIEGR